MTEWARGFQLADFQLHMLCWSTSNIVAIFVAPIRIAIYAKTGGLSRSGASIVQSCSFPRTGWDAKRYQSMGRQDSTKLLSSTLFGYPRTGRTSSNASNDIRLVQLPSSRCFTLFTWPVHLVHLTGRSSSDNVFAKWSIQPLQVKPVALILGQKQYRCLHLVHPEQ